MNLEELKKKTPAELILQAEELAIAEEKENGDAEGETNAIES